MRIPLQVMMLGVLAVGAQAQTRPAAAPNDLVKASLIADTTAMVPGQAFRVGVVLEVKPDWHIYWKNAGETGLPTEISIKAPEGFEVGAVQYPVPTKFIQPGEIEGYGYSDQVMFIVSVMSSPTMAAAGESVTIGADVSFLACEKVCIPGKATAQLTLPVAKEGEPAVAANVDEFTQWKARVPVAAGTLPNVAAVNVAQDKGHFTITTDWKEPATDVDWFAAAEAALNVTEPKVVKTENQTILQFNAAVLQGLSLESKTMPVVIAFTDANGVRRGIEVSVPLESIAPQAD